MPQEEIYNTRDRSYSAWHRRESTRRFVGIETAQVLAMIDLDASLYVEYDDSTKEPLALIETARDVGQDYKPATVTTRLAQRCNPILPAYVLLYRLADERNPADKQWWDIAEFRVMRLHPQPDKEWRTYTPDEWARFLTRLRVWSARKIDAEYADNHHSPES
jgi:hypothetical protein